MANKYHPAQVLAVREEKIKQYVDIDEYYFNLREEFFNSEVGKESKVAFLDDIKNATEHNRIYDFWMLQTLMEAGELDGLE